MVALGASLLIGIIAVVPVIIGILPSLSGVTFRTCMDGNFRIADINSPYDVRTIFAISLGFGSFDFAVAKGIDIVFDLIVGRGGQLLLGLVSYPVFAKVLLHSMERRPASYQYFTAMAFETVSVFTMGQIARNLGPQPRGKHTLRTILIPIGLLIASLYILAFPTLASAATGYSTSQDPYVSLGGNGTSPWPDLKFVDNGTLSTDSTSNFMDTKLDAPPLTIEQMTGYEMNGNFYSNEYLEEFGFCKPNNNKYKWGFSYLLLFIIIIFTYAWAGILVALHIDTEKNSQLAKCGRRLGQYRAVLDLSKAIREELGEEAQLLPNHTLEKRLAEAKDGLRYQVPVDVENSHRKASKKLADPNFEYSVLEIV
ncbi:hypothetical protein BKCO1_7600019 [Neofusicoccum parvum]|uniref:Uncharacterized protein n=1 Tax=Neofusicoccum parvum TaxID=310453 RepID=A0ACB5SC51_9PEZI|nr:hypothetical protein BKCO1_7600019 [Neofusicoccum parvum]